MRLFEAIVQANHRAVAGDASAGLRLGDFAQSLPIAALTCIDPRLNAFMPNVLGVPEEQFIWLRNAGNIITGPQSSTSRSIALACAVKGARELAVIGHTDCLVCKTGALELISRFSALGVVRAALPDNLNEFFGLFASERQNVMQAVSYLRESPLIGKQVPVHGLLVDIRTGRLEWLVNGYDAPPTSDAGTTAHSEDLRFADLLKGSLAAKLIDRLADSKVGDAASHHLRIGESSMPEPAGTPAPKPLSTEPAPKPAKRVRFPRAPELPQTPRRPAGP